MSPTKYEERTKSELLELAAEKEIEGRSSMSKDELIAALRGEEPKKEEPKKEAAPKPKPKPRENIADPIEQILYDRGEFTAEAVAAVDDSLAAEEEADTAALLEARSFFNAYRFSNPFRFLIALAYAAGHGKKPLD